MGLISIDELRSVSGMFTLALKHAHFLQDDIQDIYTAKSWYLSLNEFRQVVHVLSNICNNFERNRLAFKETPELAQVGRLHWGWKKSG